MSSIEVWACLATSLDGKIHDGTSRYPNFTSRHDREKLFKLRSLVDVLLVGANTVRQESLPPVIRNADLVAERRAAGRPDHPDLAIVTGAAAFDWTSSYFTSAKQRILILADEPADEARASAQSLGLELIQTRASLAERLATLAQRGYARVLCEGGGRLIHGLIAEGLLDRLYLTIAPTIIGGRDTPSLVMGEVLKPRPTFDLESLQRVGDELHLEYVLRRGAQSA